jgi:ABC-2 type transport system permease protein
MLVLLRKEISSFLSSLIGYIVIIIFLIINSLFLWVLPLEFNVLEFGYANLYGLFSLAPFIFLFLVPAITMRSFAEEKKTGTIEWLVTKPLSDTQIILAKYFASVLLVLFSLLPTLVYYYSVHQLGYPVGNLDSGGIWGSYIGLFFLASAFVAIGIFASSLSDNQILSLILAVFLSAFAYGGFQLIHNLSLFGDFDLFIKSLGISAHYASMSRGVIDTRDLIYFLSIISLFLLMTKISLERRKW